MELFSLDMFEKDFKNFIVSEEKNINSERNFMVEWMRLRADRFEIRGKDIIIPDGCEKYGLIEGKHNIGKMMRFFAVMLEQ